MLRTITRAGVLSVLMALLVAPSALAAFPGTNGKIAFATMRDEPDPTGCGARGGCNSEIYTINADGTGLTRLTNDPAFDWAPAWSPDGKQMFFTRDERLYKMHADGSGVTSLSDGTAQGGFGVEPTWSPDGTKMAFVRFGLWVSDADATDQTQIGPPGPGKTGPRDPAWSPDGTKIAFSHSSAEFGPRDIYTINPDGTGQTKVTNVDVSQFLQYAEDPNWSPDGDRIAFFSNKDQDGNNDIYTIAPDGSGEVRVTDEPDHDHMPSWSPDGTRIAFSRDGASTGNEGDIYIMNPDGTGQINITNSAANDFTPDWQPVQPPPGYPRPLSASPLRVSLVTAFRECDGSPNRTPNRTHGPPLEYPSCAPPVTISPAKVGTPDATGSFAKSVGVVRYRTIVGAPGGIDDADVSIRFDVTDVLCRYPHWAQYLPCGAPNSTGTPEDYTGELRASVGVRITDRDNGGPPDAGTVSDTTFSVIAPCAETSDTTIGSRCSVETTADAVIPGSVKEGKRTIWQLGQVTVFDGGPDGQAETPTDDAVFLRQGIFIP